MKHPGMMLASAADSMGEMASDSFTPMHDKQQVINAERKRCQQIFSTSF